MRALTANKFLEDWIGAWDDWELEIRAIYDAGDMVSCINVGGQGRLAWLLT
jgi:hypothetical protein